MASYVLMRINLEGQNDLGQGTKRGVLSNQPSEQRLELIPFTIPGRHSNQSAATVSH